MLRVMMSDLRRATQTREVKIQDLPYRTVLVGASP